MILFNDTNVSDNSKLTPLAILYSTEINAHVLYVLMNTNINYCEV